MKKVIIIGATSGIGRALAEMYAKNNCIVGATGRRRELLDSLQEEFPENIVYECFDVTQDENVECMKNLIQQIGGLDLLIYNTGYGVPSNYLEWDIDNNTNDNNVNGFLEIINFTFNYFLMEGKGQIAATSSIASIQVNRYAPAFSAGKTCISSYMEGLYLKAKQLKAPIIITDIQRGFVKTALAKSEKQCWVTSVDKATQQIYQALEQKKRVAYITKRWWLIAKIMKHIPMYLHEKIG